VSGEAATATPPSGDPDGWILADPNPDAPPSREVIALRALADHLEPRLGHYLRRLLADDSDAHRYGEMRGRVERADGVVRELRRIVDTRTGVLDEWIARAKWAEARVADAEARARGGGNA
jgi:hypothetical protein